MYISAITTGLQAVATILSAVKTITASMRSLADTPERQDPESKRKGVRLGMHKWILMAGAVVGLVTIAYLENIVINYRAKKKAANEKQEQEKFEHVYVSG